jgi:hypothetical protein
LRKGREATLSLRIVFVAPREHANAPHARLLCARRNRPNRRAAEKGDEVAPPHLAPREVGFPILRMADRNQRACAPDHSRVMQNIEPGADPNSFT